MSPDKKQQVEQVNQDPKKSEKNDRSSNQADGFRYDYDDSSDLK
ncbi:hypothetical protein [Mesobacillus boroniphilus]|nr:hypothetical protein [Mesobacillus boroniphilus]